MNLTKTNEDEFMSLFPDDKTAELEKVKEKYGNNIFMVSVFDADGVEVFNQV